MVLGIELQRYANRISQWLDESPGQDFVDDVDFYVAERLVTHFRDGGYHAYIEECRDFLTVLSGRRERLVIENSLQGVC